MAQQDDKKAAWQQQWDARNNQTRQNMATLKMPVSGYMPGADTAQKMSQTNQAAIKQAAAPPQGPTVLDQVKANNTPALTPPASGGVTYGQWKPLTQETLNRRKALDAEKLEGSHLPDPQGFARPEAAAISAAGGMDAYKAGLNKDYADMQRSIDQRGQAQQMVDTALATDAENKLNQETALSKIPVVGEQLFLPGSPNTPVYMYDHAKGSDDYAKYGARTYTDGSTYALPDGTRGQAGMPKQEGLHRGRTLNNMTINPTGKLVDPTTGNVLITNDPGRLSQYDKDVAALKGEDKDKHNYEMARQAQVIDFANQNEALQPARDQLRKTMNTPGDQRLDYDKVINQLYPPQQAQAPSWDEKKRAEFQAKEKAQEEQARQFNMEMAKEKMLEQFKSKITGGDKPELNWTAYQDMLNEEDPKIKAQNMDLLRQLGLLPPLPQDSQ